MLAVARINVAQPTGCLCKDVGMACSFRYSPAEGIPGLVLVCLGSRFSSTGTGDLHLHA